MIEGKQKEKKLSIVVIEDNLGDFVLIEDYLLEKYKTVKITHCVNYKSATEYLENKDNTIDLILLDLNLPDKDGLELVSLVIENSNLKPIIVLTGYAELSLAKKSLAIGAYDFLIKDEINPNLLHKSIEFTRSRKSFMEHIESQNKKLREIAWEQSHVLRAPLSRMLGIIEMISTLNTPNEELPFWLDQLKTTSSEMDTVVQAIVSKTQVLKS